jgi:hypothetical protein
MNTLPREIIVDVLKHVPFKQLFGNCALINSEFRVLIYNPPIPFPVAADFAIKANDRFSTIRYALNCGAYLFNILNYF